MPTTLMEVEIMSIYPLKKHEKANLTQPAAQCTPDTKAAVMNVKADLAAKGVELRLSDMFRSHDMQLQAHIENAKKHVFSPLPGGSMHEAGRAIDLDLDTLLARNVISLKDFWEIAGRHGFSPIVSEPNPQLKESWHFDCRGSHNLVREYYREGKGGTKMKPYEAMAASGILAIGQKVDQFQNQKAAAIQSALIRLGHDLGSLDGGIGTRTRTALDAAGVPFADEDTMLSALENQLKQKFPKEFSS